MTHPASRNSLFQSLLQLAPELLSDCARVSLKAGPWPAELAEDDGCLYFPEDSLWGLSTSSGAPQGVRLALLGCHHVWSPQRACSSGLRAEVLVPGQALRVSESLVRAAGARTATWWLQEAASAQALLAQMARMVFCAQHHQAAQSLASWLLLAQQHSPSAALRLPERPWRAWLAWRPEVWQSAWDTLESQQAVALVRLEEGDVMALKALAPLSTLACPCHQTPPRD